MFSIKMTAIWKVNNETLDMKTHCMHMDLHRHDVTMMELSQNNPVPALSSALHSYTILLVFQQGTKMPFTKLCAR
jgi:hypothetical protein